VVALEIPGIEVLQPSLRKAPIEGSATRSHRRHHQLDPVTIAERATFANPTQYPTGISYVIVNGVPVIGGGTHTGALPGRVLRRRGTHLVTGCCEPSFKLDLSTAKVRAAILPTSFVNFCLGFSKVDPLDLLSLLKAN
jgi:hypothetical protein